MTDVDANRPRPAELTLDEPFHRIKRTLMLLCGSLILLGSTAPTVARAALGDTPGLIGQAVAATSFLRFALWITAAYYAWGFFHMSYAAYRANRDLLDPGQLASYETQIKTFVDWFGERATELDKQLAPISKEWEAITSRFTNALNDPEPAMAERRAAAEWQFDERHLGWSARITDETERARLIEEKQKSGDAAAAKAQFLHYDVLVGAKHSADELLKAWGSTSQLIRAMANSAEAAAKRVTINRGMYHDRRVQFFYWEVGATCMICVLATLTTFTTVGFVFAAWVAGASHWLQ